MFARCKLFVLSLAVVPVIASLGLTAPSSAVANRQQVMNNGSFNQGRVGWYAGGAPTRFAIVYKGRAGSRAARLTNRRPAPAVLNSRSGRVRSAGSGQRYTVSAWIRSSAAGARGRMVLRETSNGRAVKNSVKRFRAWRTWHKVVMSTTAQRDGTDLSVRLILNRMGKRKFLIVDDVSILRWLPPTPDPTPTPTDPTPTDPTPTPTDPTPTDPTPTDPTPTDPPTGTAGRFSNGCAYTARGLPATGCASLVGSAYLSNGDPTPWEQEMGRKLGIRRTYWGPTQVDKAVSVAKTDLAAGRLPWISFKLPHGWADMANGAGDAWARDIATKLSKLNGPVWIAFHHEPENDGDITLWTKMQARLAPIVRGAAPNVAYSIVLTGWNQFFGPTQFHLDSLWPKNTKIDMLGLDVYNRYGQVKDGKMISKETDMENDYFKPTNTWAKAHNVAWGIAETGWSDEGAKIHPTWPTDTYNALKRNGGVAFTYFNTTLNSASTWYMSTAQKRSYFTDAVRLAPTL